VNHPRIRKIADGAYFVLDTLGYMNQITPFDLTMANQTVSGGLGADLIYIVEQMVPLAPEDAEPFYVS